MINIILEGDLIARSEARRLIQNFEKSLEIQLDFKNVNYVGQAFSHELFVVFKKRHPEIILKAINMNDDVKKMIIRVQNT